MIMIMIMNRSPGTIGYDEVQLYDDIWAILWIVLNDMNNIELFYI